MKTAAVVFGTLFAFAASVAAAPNITHKATADFFSYVENGPIGSGWSENVPSAYIPGGVNPANAVSRLTDAETRHAFIGTFDAYFRRLMASVAFGTPETKVYNKRFTNDPRAFKIANAADWRTEDVIPKVFANVATNGWYLATNRDYAVTNVTVSATNWVGYDTNIVYNPAGKPVGVKIENRYEIVSTTMPDTSRILDELKKGHDYARGFGKVGGGENPNGLRYLVDIRPGDWTLNTDGYIDHDAFHAYQWPWELYTGALWQSIHKYTNQQHQVVTTTNFNENATWSSEELIGWSFSQLDRMWPPPQGVADPFAWTTDGEWHEHLKDCAVEGGWGWFFPTTWDLFDAPFSRKKVAAAFFEKAQSAGNRYLWDGLLEYEATCPNEWAELIRSVCDNPFGGMRMAITNSVDGSVDLLPVGTAGFAMLTNLVDISVAWTHEYVATNISPSGSGDIVTNVVEAIVTNRQSLAHIVPNVETFRRIDWSEWAGDNGFLALADTAIVGPWAMPQLLYDIAQTNVYVDVTYAFPSNNSSYMCLHGWVGSSNWTVTNVALNIARQGQSVRPGAGEIRVDWLRNESAMVDPGLEIVASASPGEILLPPSNEYDAGIGINRMCDSKYDVGRWMSMMAYPGLDNPLQVGDLVYFEWGVPPSAYPGDVPPVWVDVHWRGGQWRIHEFPNPEFYIDFQELHISGYADALMETTKAVRPFAYNLNRHVYETNSIPCAYPNGSYVGADKVEKVAEIKATALSAISSTTDVEYNGAGYYDLPEGWATNGYRFAFATERGTHAKFVDQTFQDADDLMGNKMKQMAEEVTGLPQTDNAQELGDKVLSMFDERVIRDEGKRVAKEIEDMMNNNDRRLEFDITTMYDPAWARITGIDKNDAGYPVRIRYETVRQDTNGVWQATGEDLWRCYWVNLRINTSTNKVVEKRGVCTRGRVTGLEAVKWDFDAMHRHTTTNPTP